MGNPFGDGGFFISYLCQRKQGHDNKNEVTMDNEYTYEKLDILMEEECITEREYNRYQEMLTGEDMNERRAAIRMIWAAWFEWEGLLGYGDDLYNFAEDYGDTYTNETI